jgi:hypothetical protein
VINFLCENGVANPSESQEESAVARCSPSDAGTRPASKQMMKMEVGRGRVIRIIHQRNVA